MFDTLEALKGGEEGSNMYEIVYSKGKSLKDDNRLAYYSYFSVLCYKEVIYLTVFSILYTCASGINMQLIHPMTTTADVWPFVRYA